MQGWGFKLGPQAFEASSLPTNLYPQLKEIKFEIMYNIRPKEISEIKNKYKNKIGAERTTESQEKASLLTQAASALWEENITDGLHLLDRSAIYLEGGLFFQAGTDDNVSFPRYCQIGNGQEQGTLTRWS